MPTPPESETLARGNPSQRPFESTSESLSSADDQHLADLSVQLWKDIQLASTKVADTIGKSIADPFGRPREVFGSETFRLVLDSLQKLSPPAQPPVSKPEWTVVLDMTTDFDQNKDGTFNRVNDLTAFAERTKGNNLAIVVQAAYRDPRTVPLGVAYTPTFRLERHLIRDGKITKVAEGKSQGYGPDLEELLLYAGKHTPANKMALIMDSHGVGNEGLEGDTGKLSMDDFVKIVHNGLKPSGKEKFDLIDFDACLMAQNGALSRMGKIADHVVASAETEPSKGISLIPPLEELLKKPETSGQMLGRRLIAEARTQAIEFEERKDQAPLRTVASFDMRKYDEFGKSLDEFGDKLTALINDPVLKETVIKIIDSTIRYGSNDFEDGNKADLKDFAQRIILAVDDGRLPDDDRSLKRTAYSVQQTLGDFVDSFYGHKTTNAPVA